MQIGYRALWRRLGRVEQVFLALALLYALLMVSGLSSGLQVLTAVAVFVFGVWSLFRVGRSLMRKAIWRLRNRLIVAYLFIAVVPIVLILTLALITSYALIGSIAVYFVRTELANRETALLNQAQRLAGRPRAGAGTQREGGRFGNLNGPGRRGGGLRLPPIPPGGTQASGDQTAESYLSMLASEVRERYPGSEVLIVSGTKEFRYPPTSKISSPLPEWGRAGGLILKNDGDAKRLYLWAHATGSFATETREVTILTPVTSDILSELVPSLGNVTVFGLVPDGGRSRVPGAVNAFDLRVSLAYPVQVAIWEAPNDKVSPLLLVESRISAVLAKVFEQKAGQESLSAGLQVAFLVLVGLFLMVEVFSLWAGIKITRTMTGAVHELYEGTQRVREGDFTHRIQVTGDDQLAELSTSFNIMTENLGKLIVVAQEKERLQSELEIAREVQKQLFPRDTPSSKTLQLTGVCNPARVVSGDYYDFLTLPASELAFAIGDVAGKGISAALLMATIQSTMRTQLNAVNGAAKHLSAAGLVAQLNKQLYANTTPEKYATFYFALYDEARCTLTYTNAGHLSPLLMRAGEFTDLSPTGTVVGAFPFARYEERSVNLEVGDIVVAYTDGIVEPENSYGEMFGEDRLKELMVRYAYADSSEIIARTMEAVAQWTGAGELQDDMTMVVARRV